MKWKIVLLFAALFTVASFSVASAAPPDVQPWMYSAVHCTGLGNVEAVRSAFGRYQDAYAADHQLVGAQWQATYDAVVSEFVRKHGCTTGGIVDGVLAFDFRVYLPVYLRDFDILPSAFAAAFK